MDWNDNQPIFRQLSERISEQILQGVWLEETPLPSLRLISADMKINHLTVMKGYQLLVDKGLVEKRRGQGMFVVKGALDILKKEQKSTFLDQQIPAIAQTLEQINMPLEAFIQQLKQYMKDKE